MGRTRSCNYRPCRLGNRRGAAVLLASYLACLSLLILGAVSLQRTMHELRAAQVSRDVQQAFWLAEEALDKAMAQLRSGQDPAVVSVGSCTGLTTLPGLEPDTQSSYRLCRESANGTIVRYRIESTGTAQAITQRVTALVDTHVATTIQFKHAAYASYIGWLNSTSGSTDTSNPSTPLNPPRNTTSHGDVALAPQPYWPNALMVFINSPLLPGTIYAYVTEGQTPEQHVNLQMGTPPPAGGFQPLSAGELKQWPAIEIPLDATNLGMVEMHGSGDNRCLAPGSYVASQIYIVNDQLYSRIDDPTQPQLCTTGPVDLYVTGPVDVLGGKIYGQPLGSLPYSQRYSPENLRLFYAYSTRPDAFSVGIDNGVRDSLIAGTIYAPQTDVLLVGGSVLLGGLITRAVYGLGAFSMGTESSDIFLNPFPTFLFDEALLTKKFAVNHTGVALRMWTYDGTVGTTQSSSTSSSTPVTGGGTAICTELHRQGYLSDQWFAADSLYANTSLDAPTRRAYLLWARPLVIQMQRSYLVSALVRPFGLAWAQHMAYLMGASAYDNLLGRCIHELGVPLHRLLGMYLDTPPLRINRTTAR